MFSRSWSDAELTSFQEMWLAAKMHKQELNRLQNEDFLSLLKASDPFSSPKIRISNLAFAA